MAGPARAARARGQLVIELPAATSPADSDRIVVRPTPDTVATLKGAQWAENLPRLVQTRLLQSFENARLLRAVGRPGEGVDATRTLTSEIRRFDIDIANTEAVVEVAVKIIAPSTGRILAARIFSAQAPAPKADGPGAARALDQALGEVMRQIVAWGATAG